MRPVFLLAVLATALSGCSLATIRAPLDATGADADSVAPRIARWTVRASLTSRPAPPLVRVSIGPPRASRGPGGWVEHRLVFTNLARRPVQLGRTRSAAVMLGHPGHKARLFATTGLCGFVPTSHRARFTVACLAMLDLVTVKPGASHAVTVTLSRGRPGMDPLRAGVYRLRLPFTVQVGPPGAERVRHAALRIVYDLERAQATAG